MRQGLIHDTRAGNRKRDYKQNELNLDLENTEWLSKAANTWRVLNAEPDSELDINTEWLGKAANTWRVLNAENQTRS